LIAGLLKVCLAEKRSDCGLIFVDKDKTACGGGSVFLLMYTEKLFL
jgi:hypothetical protein